MVRVALSIEVILASGVRNQLREKFLLGLALDVPTLRSIFRKSGSECQSIDLIRSLGRHLFDLISSFEFQYYPCM